MINVEEIENLISKGLVQKKTFENGLSVYKYKNKVFYDNLWHISSQLNYCRGLVLDSQGNVVIWPFTKIFNRFENNTDLPLDLEVVSVEKMNGFMASASLNNGNLIVSTTGSLSSPHSEMARGYLTKLGQAGFLEGITYLFEICSPEDPHIIDEDEGAYLIGARVNENGHMVCEGSLDVLAFKLKCKRPKWKICKFSEVVSDSRICEHEGFVVRDKESGELLLKIKSPHYLLRKFFMRGSSKKWDKLWDNPKDFKKTIDEEYYPIVEFLLTKEKSWWCPLNEQQRKQELEKLF